MFFESLLLGRPARWDFAGGLGLNSWIDARPWESDGGVYVVSVAPDFPGDLYFRALHKLVCSCADGLRIRAQFLDLSDASMSLRQAIGEHIGWHTNDGQHKFREMLREHQATTEGLVYFVLTGKSGDIDEAFVMADFCAKSGVVCPFTIFVLSTGSNDSAVAQHIDMKTGWISEALFQDLENKTELELWHSYNYHRFIWEAAGSPMITRLMEQKFVESGVLERSESTTERVLEDIAEYLSGQCEIQLDELVTFIGNGREIGVQSDSAELRAKDFAAIGLLWRPRQCNDWILPGWVARSLLKRKKRVNPWLLRRSLNCLSITGDIFAACISLEMGLRQKYVTTLSNNHLTPDALEHYAAWQKRSRDEFICYSAEVAPNREFDVMQGGPKYLADAWIFSSLGEIQQALKAQSSTRYSTSFLDAINQLRLLRNSLAHSHPIAWNHIVALKGISALV